MCHGSKKNKEYTLKQSENQKPLTFVFQEQFPTKISLKKFNSS